MSGGDAPTKKASNLAGSSGGPPWGGLFPSGGEVAHPGFFLGEKRIDARLVYSDSNVRVLDGLDAIRGRAMHGDGLNVFIISLASAINSSVDLPGESV